MPERQVNELKKRKSVLHIALSVLVVIALFLLVHRETGHSVQTTDTVLMVRPVNFGYNAETAVNNTFQKEGVGDNIPELARKESDAYIELLRENGKDDRGDHI